MNAKELKAKEKLLLKQAREDYRFFKAEIKLFMTIARKVATLLPPGWEYSYHCGSARTLILAKTGLDYRGKKNGRDMISTECAYELRRIKNIVEEQFNDYLYMMPCYREVSIGNEEFQSMTGEMEKSFPQKNGRDKKLRIRVYYYQYAADSPYLTAKKLK